jgi:hypothetical protein
MSKTIESPRTFVAPTAAGCAEQPLQVFTRASLLQYISGQGGSISVQDLSELQRNQPATPLYGMIRQLTLQHELVVIGNRYKITPAGNLVARHPLS